jgi:hypothetical protein
VKKSMVDGGGETGLARALAAGHYTIESARAQALSGEKIFQNFCAVTY